MENQHHLLRRGVRVNKEKTYLLAYKILDWGSPEITGYATSSAHKTQYWQIQTPCRFWNPFHDPGGQPLSISLNTFSDGELSALQGFDSFLDTLLLNISSFIGSY